jgi:hypothetical protein
MVTVVRQSTIMPFHKTRISLVIGAALFTVMTFPPVFAAEWSLYNHILGSSKIEAFPWKEPSKEAFSSRIALSKDLFQSGLLLIAAMWGLVLLKKDETAVVFDLWPERAPVATCYNFAAVVMRVAHRLCACHVIPCNGCGGYK